MNVPFFVDDMIWALENGCFPQQNHLSHEKFPGCLDYLGDYTTQLYRDDNQ